MRMAVHEDESVVCGFCTRYAASSWPTPIAAAETVDVSGTQYLGSPTPPRLGDINDHAVRA
jgi:hypothetical protein